MPSVRLEVRSLFRNDTRSMRRLNISTQDTLSWLPSTSSDVRNDLRMTGAHNRASRRATAEFSLVE